METYLVGGAVRDRLLGLEVRERDHVVVGSTPEAMQAAGFRQVGKDFPVFLHPETGEEHALARTERKSGRGHTGFQVHADPDVTLEQDLERRDLTINAIAESADGERVDPFGGVADLEARWLRHVSPAFVEDPLRVLRVARFAARFADLGFRVHDSTLALMRDMVASGELEDLVPERVWTETRKALETTRPSRFLEVLRACGALAQVLPEVDALFGVPQPERWHPEVDTGVHTLLVVDAAADLSDEPEVRFAALVHDLGKGVTPESEWPSHRGHEQAGVPLVDALCERIRTPKSFRELGRLAARYHLDVHRAFELRPQTVLKLLASCDAFRRPERFEHLLAACWADLRGRTGMEQRPYPQADWLRAALQAAIEASRVDTEGLAGPEIAERVAEQRRDAIARAREQHPHDGEGAY